MYNHAYTKSMSMNGTSQWMKNFEVLGSNAMYNRALTDHLSSCIVVFLWTATQWLRKKPEYLSCFIEVDRYKIAFEKHHYSWPISRASPKCINQAYHLDILMKTLGRKKPKFKNDKPGINDSLSFAIFVARRASCAWEQFYWQSWITIGSGFFPGRNRWNWQWQKRVKMWQLTVGEFQ